MTRIVCKGILFDLDGVLVDSTPAVGRVWSAWAREHGLDPEAVVRVAHGRPSLATVRELLPHADHAAENALIEQREIADMDGMVTLPGAIELLSVLPADRWGIVTSGTRALASTRLRAAGLPIPTCFVTATDIARGKPDPEPYLIGIKRLGFPAADCIVIEDAPSGVRSGRAAGARVIGVRTTAKDDELRRAGANWIVDNLGAVAGTSIDDSIQLELRIRA